MGVQKQDSSVYEANLGSVGVAGEGVGWEVGRIRRRSVLLHRILSSVLGLLAQHETFQETPQNQVVLIASLLPLIGKRDQKFPPAEEAAGLPKVHSTKQASTFFVF